MSQVLTAGAPPLPPREPGPWLSLPGRLWREKPLGAVGGIIFAIFLFCGVFADLLAPYGLNDTNMLERLQPRLSTPG